MGGGERLRRSEAVRGFEGGSGFASRREQGAGCGALPGGLPGSGNPAVARDARTDDER